MSEFSLDDSDVLDRLVDGELDEAEYRRLLLYLERQPDGWRRCALAFLEAQTWRREMSSLRGERTVAAGAPRATRASSSGRPSWQLLLAVAASFLITLALGTLYRRSLMKDTPVPVDGSLVEMSLPANELPIDGRVMETEDSRPIESSTPNGPTLAMETSDDIEDDTLEIPLYDWSPRNAWLLDEQASAFPRDLARILENLGNRVQRQRDLVPLETEDGRRVLIPIERVEITPVGLGQYR